MPFLNLVVNVKVDDPKALVQELSRLGATVLEKPESLISVCITYNETLTFAGTFDPAFNLRIDCLGRTLGDHGSQVLSNFIKEKLGISNDRGFIVFYDPGRINVGYKGSTFETLLGSAK